MVIDDGYDGHWTPIQKTETVDVPRNESWPMALPKLPILILKTFVSEGVLNRWWVCKECGWVSETSTIYQRPQHTCSEESILAKRALIARQYAEEKQARKQAE